MLDIKNALQRCNVTQRELANRLGVPFQGLNSIVNGKGNPTIGTIEKIANALGVPIVELFAHDTEVHGYVRVRTDLHEVKSFRDLQRLVDLEHTTQQTNNNSEI